MEKVFFDHIIEFKKKSTIKAGTGLALNEGNYPFYTSSNTLSKSINEFLFEGESLIFGTGGQASIHFCSEKFAVSTDCFVTQIKNPEEWSTKFIYHFLSGNIHLLENGFKGAGLKHISKEYLKNISIPKLPLQTQKAIAAKLDKAQEIISYNQQLLEKYDQLTQALFIDMFGDPFRNEKKFNLEDFGKHILELTDYHANGSYESLKEVVELKDERDFALMVRTTDLEKNNFENDVKYISETAYNFLGKSKVFGNEIIINKIGSAGNVYLMPVLNRPVSLGMNAFLLRFNEETLNINYIYFLLKTKYGESEIHKRVKGAVTKTIRKDAIREIPIIVPPIELQNKFAERIEKIKIQKQMTQESLAKSEELFQSLLKESF